MKRRIRLIKCEHITKIFPGQSVPVLSDVNFQAGAGEIVSILGPNGAGKTTIIKIFSTMIRPTGGQAWINGFEVNKSPQEVRQSIGLCAGMAERSFYYRLTGWQNLEFYGTLIGLRGKKLKTRIAEVLDLLELTPHQNKYFMKYSAGMKKRLSLARALLGSTPVYLLDEPTSGIDAPSVKIVESIIRNVSRNGSTVLLATHDLKQAQELSHSVVILKDGAVLVNDSPALLTSALSNKRIIARFGNVVPLELINAVKSIPHVTHLEKDDITLTIYCDNEANIDLLLRLILESDVNVEELTAGEPKLEEVFVRITQSGGHA